LNYFTERHGMRKPIERTSIITIEMYALLFDCSERYFNNLAWRFPDMCPDGNGCCGLDNEKFNNELTFEIPTLFRNKYNIIAKPSNISGFGKVDDFDQFALLDLIEFIGQNCRDFSNRDYHDYFRHYHLNLYNTDNIYKYFQQEINNIFEKTGLLFTLTSNKIIERVIDNDVLSDKIENDIKNIKEQGTKQLLEEAITLFKQPNPTANKNAVEKIWDALERLKTYYVTLDKKGSVSIIIDNMSNGQDNFIKLFNDEFKTLTDIGNNFRIRHHETNKTDINDVRHYDYFFNRCLALISLAIKYLK